MQPSEIVIDCIGEVTGERYRGVFKIRPRLSHKDTLLKDQFRRDLLGKDADLADPSAINVAEVFSKIWAHVIEAPMFWRESNRGLDLLDEAPIVQAYGQIIAKEKEVVEAIKRKAEEAVKELTPDAK